MTGEGRRRRTWERERGEKEVDWGENGGRRKRGKDAMERKRGRKIVEGEGWMTKMKGGRDGERD